MIGTGEAGVIYNKEHKGHKEIIVL